MEAQSCAALISGGSIERFKYFSVKLFGNTFAVVPYAYNNMVVFFTARYGDFVATVIY